MLREGRARGGGGEPGGREGGREKERGGARRGGWFQYEPAGASHADHR